MAITISGSGITSANIADGTIVNADINSSAAIDGSKLTGAGKVLQVVSFTTASTNTFNSNSWVNSSVTATITPTLSTSKILIIGSIATGHNENEHEKFIRLVRGGTAIYGTTTGFAGTGGSGYTDSEVTSQALNYLDSPSTTSATTYTIQGRDYRSQSFFINRSASGHIAASTLTLMEIGV